MLLVERDNPLYYIFIRTMFDPKLDALANTQDCIGGACATNTTACAQTPWGQDNNYTPSCANPNAPVNGNQFYVDSFLKSLSMGVMPLFVQGIQNLPSILQFMFNMNDFLPYTTKGVANLGAKQVITFKNIRGIEKAQSVDGKVVTWSEYSYRPTLLKVGGAAPIVNGTIIPVSDITYFDEKDVLLIKPASATCCKDYQVRSVLAVDVINSTVTIETVAGNGVDVQVGDDIQILYSPRGDCDANAKSYQRTALTAHKTYFQNFSFELPFQPQDLNKSFCSDVQLFDYIYSRIDAQILPLYWSVGKAFYMARNIAPTNTTPGETQGLISGIYSAQATNVANGITDPQRAQLVTSTALLVTPADKVRHFLQEVAYAQQSNMMGIGSTVTAVANTKAAWTFQMLNLELNKFAGVTVTSTDNETKEFIIPKIKTPSGMVEFMQCSILSDLFADDGKIILLNKDLIMAIQRENEMYNMITNTVVPSQPGIKYFDVSDPKTPLCKTYRGILTLGFLFGGLHSGAYRIIEGWNLRY